MRACHRQHSEQPGSGTGTGQAQQTRPELTESSPGAAVGMRSAHIAATEEGVAAGEGSRGDLGWPAQVQTALTKVAEEQMPLLELQIPPVSAPVKGLLPVWEFCWVNEAAHSGKVRGFSPARGAVAQASYPDTVKAPVTCQVNQKRPTSTSVGAAQSGLGQGQ